VIQIYEQKIDYFAVVFQQKIEVMNCIKLVIIMS